VSNEGTISARVHTWKDCKGRGEGGKVQERNKSSQFYKPEDEKTGFEWKGKKNWRTRKRNLFKTPKNGKHKKHLSQVSACGRGADTGKGEDWLGARRGDVAGSKKRKGRGGGRTPDQNSC